MILAGIDEAGYGPILGPLCTGAAAFRVEGAAGPGPAAAAVAPALRPARHGVRVGDSKAIHTPAKGPRALEETVLAFLAARDGAFPADGGALHRALGVGAPPGDHPWYGSLAKRALPLAADPALVRERGRALAAALAAEGVSVAALRVRALPEGRYNEEVGVLRNKADLLFLESTALLGEVLAAAAGEAAHVVCDRQGARRRYGAPLQGRFPDRYVRVLLEGERESAYGIGPARVVFREKADAAVPATGLASILAKYVREFWMAALNGWFLEGVEGVKPTAGYWTDGLRFLAQTEGIRRGRGVDDGVLVRSR